MPSTPVLFNAPWPRGSSWGRKPCGRQKGRREGGRQAQKHGLNMDGQGMEAWGEIQCVKTQTTTTGLFVCFAGMGHRRTDLATEAAKKKDKKAADGWQRCCQFRFSLFSLSTETPVRKGLKIDVLSFFFVSSFLLLLFISLVSTLFQRLSVALLSLSLSPSPLLCVLSIVNLRCCVLHRSMVFVAFFFLYAGSFLLSFYFQ